MELYLSKLLSRVKQYSQKLDREELFVDVPWVIIDAEINQQKYIFKRNGDLIMSLNGQVTVGKWEFLTAARSLLIDRMQDKILLNQNFIDPALMVLKLDGPREEQLILANETLIPDLDVVRYLRRLFYAKNNIAIARTSDGQELEVHNYDGYLAGKLITMEESPVPDGTIYLPKLKTTCIIKDSKVERILVRQEYDTDRGKVMVEHEEYLAPSKGNLVLQNDQPAPDGKYRFGFLRVHNIKDGRII